MLKNIKTFSLLIVLANCFPIHAIQNSTANIGTALVASFCVGSSYMVTRKGFPYKMPPLSMVGASIITTAAAYHLFHRLTPLGRIKRANILLAEVARHTLANTIFEDENLFFDTVQDVYLTNDLPLISAYNHLISLVPVVHHILSLINKASAQIHQDALLQEECDASLSRANKIFKNISDAIKRIREHKNYLPQLTLYKESLTQEKQTIAQEQMALAQLQMANAQQSNTLLNWLKALFGRK